LRQNLALLNYLIDTVRTYMALGFCLKSHLIALVHQYKVPKIGELPDFNGGLVGYFGYEIIRYIEPKLAC
jgi:anthranilate/para-aminobenzoate synthase component I